MHWTLIDPVKSLWRYEADDSIATVTSAHNCYNFYQELEDPMLSIGIVSDTKEIQEIVNTLDKDANGLIDFQEFVEILTPHHAKSAATQEKHERMFMQLTKKMEVSMMTYVGSQWLNEQACDTASKHRFS